MLRSQPLQFFHNNFGNLLWCSKRKAIILQKCFIIHFSLKQSLYIVQYIKQFRNKCTVQLSLGKFFYVLSSIDGTVNGGTKNLYVLTSQMEKVVSRFEKMYY